MDFEKIEDLIETHIIQKSKAAAVESTITDVELGGKKAKKKSGKMYFTTETENAIILYNHLKNQNAKNIVYSRYIHTPIQKLVENIFNTFKFSYFDAPAEDIQQEVVSNLILNLHKFTEGKGKAFSYFSIVAKNHLILVNNGNYTRYKNSLLISAMPDGWEVEDDFFIKERHVESSEFSSLMLDFWDANINSIFSKKRDIRIADAVLELFRQSDRLENFNKKALYVYIREMTDCKTQYITKVIKLMRDVQLELMEDYRVNGNVDSVKERYASLFWEEV